MVPCEDVVPEVRCSRSCDTLSMPSILAPSPSQLPEERLPDVIVLDAGDCVREESEEWTLPRPLTKVKRRVCFTVSLSVSR